MDQIVYFIIGGVVGIVAGYFSAKMLKDQSNERKPRVELKEKNKEKILKQLNERNKISNDDVERLLGVADSSATRYLEELEKEGKIKQVGRTGQSVFYQKK